MPGRRSYGTREGGHVHLQKANIFSRTYGSCGARSRLLPSDYFNQLSCRPVADSIAAMRMQAPIKVERSLFRGVAEWTVSTEHCHDSGEACCSSRVVRLLEAI